MPPSSTHAPYPFLGWLVLFIASANLVAYFFKLYFYWWWLDIPMHLLSGFWVGMTVLALYYRGKHPLPVVRTSWALFGVAVASALFIGFCWEIFELLIGMTTLDPKDAIDSLGDLFNDLMGGYLSFFVAYKKKYYLS